LDGPWPIVIDGFQDFPANWSVTIGQEIREINLKRKVLGLTRAFATFSDVVENSCHAFDEVKKQ
jgi:hypothetical protein